MEVLIKGTYDCSKEQNFGSFQGSVAPFAETNFEDMVFGDGHFSALMNCSAMWATNYRSLSMEDNLINHAEGQILFLSRELHVGFNDNGFPGLSSVSVETVKIIN